MNSQLTTGQAARELQRPTHQVRRIADSLWPDLPRVAGCRIIDRSKLAELAAELVSRFDKPKAEVSQ